MDNFNKNQISTAFALKEKTESDFDNDGLAFLDWKRREVFIRNVVKFFNEVETNPEIIKEHQDAVGRGFNIFRMLMDAPQFDVYVTGWWLDDDLDNMQKKINALARNLLKKSNNFDEYIQQGPFKHITDKIRPMNKIQNLLRAGNFPLIMKDDFLEIIKESLTMLCVVFAVCWGDDRDAILNEKMKDFEGVFGAEMYTEGLERKNISSPKFKYYMDEDYQKYMEEDIIEALSMINIKSIKLKKKQQRKLPMSNILRLFTTK